MFPDALSYLSVVLALLCMAPLLVAFYHYVVDVLRVLYLRNSTVCSIEQKLRAIDVVKRSEEEACRPPPPYLSACIQVTESEFLDLRGLAESFNFDQPPLKLISSVYHVLRGDAAISRLLKVEKALCTHLDELKKLADLAVMTTNGGHRPKPSLMGASGQIDIHAPSLPAPDVSESVPAGVGTVTLSRPPPRIEQLVRCTRADSESDFESSSGSEAGSTSGHDSQVDTDTETPYPPVRTLPRTRSFGSRRTLGRKRSTPMVPPGQNQRSPLTISNTSTSPYPSNGSPRSYPTDLVQPPRLHTARTPPQLSVITEGLARVRPGDSYEGEDTPTAPHNDTATPIYDSTTPTFPQIPTHYAPPNPPPSPARVAKRSGC